MDRCGLEVGDPWFIGSNTRNQHYIFFYSFLDFIPFCQVVLITFLYTLLYCEGESPLLARLKRVEISNEEESN